MVGRLMGEGMESEFEREDYDDSDYYDDDDPENRHCFRCDDTGWILVCIDDLCHGSGEEPGYRCIHGDGDIVCPACGGRNAF